LRDIEAKLGEVSAKQEKELSKALTDIAKTVMGR
jgi:hypothetical protein